MLRLRYHCGSIACFGSSPKLTDSPDMITIGTSASIAECMPADPCSNPAPACSSTACILPVICV
jgi:hypothetical protein